MHAFRGALRPLSIGLVLCVGALLLGFGLGAVFGVQERPIRQWLAQRADAGAATIYSGDLAMRNRAIDDGWTFFRRAHQHASGMGTAGVVLVLVLAILPQLTVIRAAAAASLGLGTLGYTAALLIAGAHVPLVGNAEAAKQPLRLLAISSAGAYIAGGAVALLLVMLWAAGAIKEPAGEDKGDEGLRGQRLEPVVRSRSRLARRPVSSDG